jgi:hypothetical protein
MTHASALTAADYGLVNGGIMEFKMTPEPKRRMLHGHPPPKPKPTPVKVVAGSCTGSAAIKGWVIEVFSAS